MVEITSTIEEWSDLRHEPLVPQWYHGLFSENTKEVQGVHSALRRAEKFLKKREVIRISIREVE